jgi:menaquinone-dependent protoporphyrinogen oxidase
MTRVLVTWSSRHGSTAEIAHAIGSVLAENGFAVDVRPMADVDTLYPYDGFVVGSAVYAGSWLRDARAFVDEHHELLATRPTWLFSSGPIGDAGADAFDASELLASTHARDHQLFPGRLQRSKLGLHERIVTGMLRVPDGDYRNWAVVTAWATAIARSLPPSVVEHLEKHR